MEMKVLISVWDVIPAAIRVLDLQTLTASHAHQVISWLLINHVVLAAEMGTILQVMSARCVQPDAKHALRAVFAQPALQSMDSPTISTITIAC